jgi:hypothetical protein
VAEDGRRTGPVDEVIVLTGLRPDLSFLSELRLGLGLDERPEAPLDDGPAGSAPRIRGRAWGR